MTECLFVSDLHGSPGRYATLLRSLQEHPPAALFLGGDLLPSPWQDRPPGDGDFIGGFLVGEFRRLRRSLHSAYPEIFVIMGNDDPRCHEPEFLRGEEEGLWHYVHNRSFPLAGFTVYGYAFVPPTPFLLKDWERYDVSRYVDPGCVDPCEGRRSVEIDPREIRFTTIATDLEKLAGESDPDRSLFLFHSPPYQTHLDRAALDGRMVESVPLDVHVGSIAIRRFIERRQPLLTMHGHVHESARITGQWRESIGRTLLVSAAHDGPELAAVRFAPEDPASATRDLLPG